MKMLEIIHFVYASHIKNAWETNAQVDKLYDVDEGVDQEMAMTHSDSASPSDETSDPVHLELPSQKL